MATKIDEALNLAKKTRTELPYENIELSAVLQNCKTICRYLGKLDSNKWIDYELNGYPRLDKTKDGQHEIPEYRKVHQIFYYVNGMHVRLSRELAYKFGTISLHNPIMEILQCKVDGMIIPVSPALDMLNSQKFKTDHDISDFEPSVSHGVISRSNIAKIINGVQNKIYEFLDNMILELEYGKIPETIFEAIRKEVDEKFRRRCPQAIEKLIVVYEQLNCDNSVGYSQIAGTCRQIIKDVADSLYPPAQFDKSDSDMELNDAKFLNRLLVGITSNNEKQLFESMFNYTTHFLHNIHSYASKGVHSPFQRSDAIRCVVYTYILLGDILHYYATKNTTTE